MRDLTRTLPESISLQSVRLGAKELDEMLDELEESAVIPARDKRKHVRISCRCKGVLVVVNQGGFESTFYIPLRDVSTSGMAFLHRSMLHTGTECNIKIRTSDRKWIQVEGTIVRSRYLKNMIYEVGLKFNKELDADAVRLLTNGGDE